MIHDSAFMVYPNAYSFLSRSYLKKMNKNIIEKSSMIITSTEFNKKEQGRIYGVPAAKKTVVIPIAFQPLIPPANFNPGDLGITKKYILSIGRLETKKNTKQLIDVFSVVKQSTDVQLVLVGRPGVGYGAVKKAIKQCAYPEDIVRFDYLEKDQLAGVLKNASVFVFPSLYEGFGLPILEAFSLGVPVVSSNIEALQEIGAGAAYYVDPLDTGSMSEAITKIVGDTGEQIKFSQKGRERVSLFSWEKTARLTWEAIANLH
jgi:glycosyltransferase involved in cell wall biosynthesis